MKHSFSYPSNFTTDSVVILDDRKSSYFGNYRLTTVASWIPSERLQEEGLGEDEALKRRVLVYLCKTLILYGAPCHRIEQSLDEAAQALEVRASFFFIPGIMMINFGDLAPETLLVRCPQGFDMGKLAQVTAVAESICNKEIAPKECIERLESITNSMPTWNPWVLVVAHAVNSLFTSPVMFNGTYWDTACSGCLGLMVGMLTLLAEKYTSYSNMFEISTTIMIGFVAKALDQWICFTGVSLSAAATLLPGYILTMSIMELSARHVITGTIRFAYALIYALFIGYGLEIGTSIYEAIDTTSSPIDFDTCTGSMPHWLYLLLFPFVAISMAMTLGATPSQWPSMICCSAVGFGTALIVGKVIADYQIIGTISAFSIGLFGNLYLKVTGELALVPLSCGIVLLVPGSVGVQGAYYLIKQDEQGTSFAVQTVVASLGIAVGLFAATLVVYPKGPKQKAIYLSY